MIKESLLRCFAFQMFNHTFHIDGQCSMRADSTRWYKYNVQEGTLFCSQNVFTPKRSYLFFPRFNVIDALCFCSRVFFTLTVTCCVRVLSSHHAVLLINLCLALIVANVLFLSGVDKTSLHVSSLRRRRTRLIITLVSSSRSTAEWISHHYVRCLLEEFIHTKCVARHPLWTNFNSQLAAYCNAFLPRDAMLAH